MISYSLKNSFCKEPSILTFGIFDGIHLGHLKIFQKMASFANHKKIILTFSSSSKKTKKLISLDQKLFLLQKLKFDQIIVLDFSKEILSLSYFDFLKMLKDHFNFHYLVLGKTALFGFNQKGSENEVKKIQKDLNFKAIYLPEKKKYQKIISTTQIKEHLLLKDFKRASSLLGRPYAIYLKNYQLNDDLLKAKTEDVFLPSPGNYTFQIDQKYFLKKTCFPKFQGEIRKTEIRLKIPSSLKNSFVNQDLITLLPLKAERAEC